jgi:uncharacterized protein (TIGR03435 family)
MPAHLFPRSIRRCVGRWALIGLVAAVALVLPRNGSAQSATARPKFEVASIRIGCGGPPSPSDADGRGSTKGGSAGAGSSVNRLSDCSTLSNFIYLAYLLYPDGRPNTSLVAPAVKGGPSWVSSDRYRIVAKPDRSATLEMMKGPMMQTLLEDRFKLKVHHEKKEVATYVLTLAKGGIRAPSVRECIAVDPANPPVPPEAGRVGPKYCGRFGLGRKGQDRIVDIDAMNMSEFAAQFSGWLDRPVIDKTGLTGRFQFHLEFAPDETTPVFGPTSGGDATSSAGPSIFTALQEQLGLKLESSKGLGDVVVIDSVERPSEN